jgi:hypothetical protein
MYCTRIWNITKDLLNLSCFSLVCDDHMISSQFGTSMRHKHESCRLRGFNYQENTSETPTFHVKTLCWEIPDEGSSLEMLKFYLHLSGNWIPCNPQLSGVYCHNLRWNRPFKYIDTCIFLKLCRNEKMMPSIQDSQLITITKICWK